MPAYDADFARFYDAYWRDFGEQVSTKILEWAAPQLGDTPRVLDLCCGTGSSSAAFVAAGWHVTGVDLSPAMVQIARHNASQTPTHRANEFIVGDIRNLPLHPNAAFDLSICLYDSLNHQDSIEGLQEALTQAALFTRPGGLLVIDLNTINGLSSWDTTNVIQDDHGTLIATGTFDPHSARAKLLIVGFAREEDGRYRKFEETHAQLAFQPSDVLDALDKAGWGGALCTTYGSLGTPRTDLEELPRIVYTAVRV